MLVHLKQLFTNIFGDPRDFIVCYMLHMHFLLNIIIINIILSIEISGNPILIPGDPNAGLRPQGCKTL